MRFRKSNSVDQDNERTVAGTESCDPVLADEEQKKKLETLKLEVCARHCVS